MKRRTFISLMGVMAAAGVLGLTGCSSKDTAASTASSATTIPPTRWWATTWRYPAPLPKSWA